MYTDKYKLTFIVEGKSDARVLSKAINDMIYLKEVNKSPDHIRQCRSGLNIIVVRGTRFGEHEKLQVEIDILLGNRIYILSDPDKGGDELARLIQEVFPTIPRIGLDPKHCTNYRSPLKRKGVEYCSVRYLRKVINRQLTKSYDIESLKTYTSTKKIITVSRQLKKLEA